MEKQVFEWLHNAADRLALEITRRPTADAAKSYIEAYEKVFEFLVGQYNKYAKVIVIELPEEK